MQIGRAITQDVRDAIRDTAIERGEHLAWRKALHDARYPETRQGVVATSYLSGIAARA